jgi:ribosomal-protein-alanine N-acetyltransferase
VTTTSRLELRPLRAAAALALFDDREAASRLIGSPLSPAWPQRDLFGILPLLRDGPNGVWVIVERNSGEVVGDVGLKGLTDAGDVEIDYSVVPDRRGLGYGPEAAQALAELLPGTVPATKT